MTDSVVIAERGAAAPATGRHRLGATLLHGRGLFGLVLVGLVVLVGALAPLLAPYGPPSRDPRREPAAPSGAHLLGTDQVNRDVLSRTLYGIRVDLVVVFVAVPLGALLGATGRPGGSSWAWVDVVTQRVFDVVLAFPTLILAIALTAFLGPGPAARSAFVIMVAEIPVFGRMVADVGAGGPGDAVRRVRPASWARRLVAAPQARPAQLAGAASSCSSRCPCRWRSSSRER